MFINDPTASLASGTSRLRPPSKTAADALPTDVLDRIVGSFSTIPPRLVQPAGTLSLFNREGGRTPIFWCFNHFAEPLLLANRLGPDQPLYAMHSFQGIVDGVSEKRFYRPHLARIYAEDILRHAGRSPIVLGGNCQSAPIIEIVARTLSQRTGRAPLLMMLEHDPRRAHDGPLLLMFGDRSETYNPFLKEADPASRWRSLHRNVAWAIVRGAHGSYFRDPGIADLTRFLRQAVDLFGRTGRLAAGEMR